MPESPHARIPPTVAAARAGSSAHSWPCSASTASSVGERGARADRDRHVGRFVREHPGRRAHLDRADRRRSADLPLRARADRGDDGRRCASAHIHAPAGTCCSSPHRLPRGSTFCGFATPSGSNASRRRACASRSSGENIRAMRSRFSMPTPCSPVSTPPAVEARVEDLDARRVHALPHALVATVEHEERVQVAVARVEHVHHDEVVRGRDLVHAPQHLDELGAGHDRVVQVVVGRDARDRAERRLAPLPQQRPFGVVGRDPHQRCAVGARDGGDRVDVGVDAAVEPVDLGEQHGLRVARVPGADEVLDRLGDAGVHHLERGRQHAGRDHAADRRGRGLDRVERAQHRGDARRVGHEPHRDPRRDPHRALRADEAAPQVVAGRVGLEAAEPGFGPVGEHDVDREHVRGGDAVGQAVRAARVGPDVAADRARLLRRRVGAVVQAEMAHRAREVEVQDPGLDPRHPRLGVDLEDPVHARGDDDDRVVERRRPARETGAAAPRDERPPVLARDAHRGRDLAAQSAGSTPRRPDRRRRRRRARTARARVVRRSHPSSRRRREGRRADGRCAGSACAMFGMLPTSVSSHGGTDTRMDHDPDPGQGTPAMAGRRHVPGVVVALHLRPGMPGRAHRARARARAGLLLLRRLRVREEGQGKGRAARQAPRRRRMAVQGRRA